jgi:hypothetical protein
MRAVGFRKCPTHQGLLMRGPLLTFRDCPFCGHDLNGDDIMDTVYPSNRERTAWQVVCQISATGCGATVYGETEEEAMDNWNKRTR